MEIVGSAPARNTRVLQLIAAACLLCSTVLIAVGLGTPEWFIIYGENTTKGTMLSTWYSVFGRITVKSRASATADVVTMIYYVWSKSCSGTNCVPVTCGDLNTASSADDYSAWVYATVCPTSQAAATVLLVALVLTSASTVITLLSGLGKTQTKLGGILTVLGFVLIILPIIAWGAVVPGQAQSSYFTSYMNGGDVSFGAGVSFFLPIIACFLSVCASVLVCVDISSMLHEEGGVFSWFGGKKTMVNSKDLITGIPAAVSTELRPFPAIIPTSDPTLVRLNDPFSFSRSPASHVIAPLSSLAHHHHADGSVHIDDARLAPATTATLYPRIETSVAGPITLGGGGGYPVPGMDFADYQVTTRTSPRAMLRTPEVSTLAPTTSTTRVLTGPNGIPIHYRSPARASARQSQQGGSPDHYFRRGNSNSSSNNNNNMFQSSFNNNNQSSFLSPPAPLSADKWGKLFPQA